MVSLAALFAGVERFGLQFFIGGWSSFGAIRPEIRLVSIRWNG
jgi:hypothetical protein